MKVAIAGAGTTGAYCYRLLKNQGLQVHLYDRERRTACGINPCAWGTSRGFSESASAAGLNPEKYILQRFVSVIMDGVPIPGDFMTFDKPAFIKDLLQDEEIQVGKIPESRYDRIIDATGISRAYLPPLQKDVLLPAFQRRLKTEERLENQIRLVDGGYAWCFPLGKMGVHIGCGTLTGNPAGLLEALAWLPGSSHRPIGTAVCACKGLLRLTGPRDSQPFFVDGGPGEVWGVGEAIGCVAPLAGDGIVPGMRSIQLLLKHWEDPDRYAQAVLKEFEWMTKERQVIDKILAASSLGIGDAWVLHRNSKRMAMKVGLKEALRFVRALKRA